MIYELEIMFSKDNKNVENKKYIIPASNIDKAIQKIKRYFIKDNFHSNVLPQNVDIICVNEYTNNYNDFVREHKL